MQHGTLKRAAVVAFAAFAGTVDSTRTEMIEGHVVTHVHLSRLKSAKGASGERTYTLHMAGGVYNGRRHWTIGQPEFQVGRRYVSSSREEPPFEVLAADEDPGARITESEFLDTIRRFSGNSDPK